MIIPWQDIAPETLENLIREFVLREGTDYGAVEISLQNKIDQVKTQLEKVKPSSCSQNCMKRLIFNSKQSFSTFTFLPYPTR